MAHVLLVRAGALGDILLLRRAVASLREADHDVHLLAPALPGGALVGPGPSEVAGVIDWDRPALASLFAEEGALPAELSRFGLAVVYSRSETLGRRLARLIPRVVAHDPSPPASGTHAAVWLARPIAEEGIRIVGPPPCRPTPEEEAAAAPWLSRLPTGFLAVHPGSGSAAKNWPAERFRALVAAASGDRPWLLVEGPAEPDSPIADARAVRTHALGPRVLGAVLRQAGLFVGNDSGISHLAAAWGAPTLALYGPTDPAVWAPVGPHVRVLRSPTGSMDDLGTQAVLRSLEDGPPGN